MTADQKIDNLAQRQNSKQIRTFSRAPKMSYQIRKSKRKIDTANLPISTKKKITKK